MPNARPNVSHPRPWRRSQPIECHPAEFAPPTTASRLRWAVLVMLLAAIAQWAAVLGGARAGPKDYDEQTYHAPTIARFAEQWPSFDLSDYDAATTPGYHLVMATATQVTGPGWLEGDRTLARLVSGSITVLLSGVFAFALAGRVRGVGAALLALPLVASVYVFTSTMRLMPEGLAWLTVALALWAVIGARCSHRAMAFVATIAVIAVLVRQSNVWIAGLAWVVAYLGSAWNADAAPWTKIGARLPRTAVAIACTIPAFAMLLGFAWVWGGLVPPSFQTPAGTTIEGATAHAGANPAVPAALLMTAGLYVIPYLLAAAPAAIDAIRRRWWMVALGALVGLAFGAGAETSFSVEEGRWGAWWALARIGPVVMDRSIVVAALATFGGAGIGTVLAMQRSRTAWILLAALAGFTAAQTANSQAWIRYLEPMVLMWFGLATAEGIRQHAVRDASPAPRARVPWYGAGALVGLVVVLASITVQTRMLAAVPSDAPAADLSAEGSP